MRPMPIRTVEKPPACSFDGYFRLTFNAFTRLAFVHKLAWEDADLGRELCAESIPAHRAGYCEWDSGGNCPVSVGWAWFQTVDSSLFISPGGVNSNLMLIDSKNYDLGASKTSELLRAWLSGIAWRPQQIAEQFCIGAGPETGG